jgi:glycogen synthase
MTSSCTIALISREYPPFFGGGIGTAMHVLAKALALAGHRPIVITTSDDGQEHRVVERVQGGEIKVVRLPFLQGQDWSALHPAVRTPERQAVFERFWPGSAWAMHVADELSRLVSELGIEVIEAPDTGALAWFILAGRSVHRLATEHDGADQDHEGAGDLSPVPVVTSIHSPTAWIQPLNREPIAGRRMRTLVEMELDQIRWSEALISPSRSLAGWVRAAGPGERKLGVNGRPIEVIPNAYALPAMRQSAGETGEPKAVFVGRLEYRKGIDTLLRAWPGVLEAMPTARLELIGSDTADPDHAGQRLGSRLIGELPASARVSVRALGPCLPENVAARVAGARVVVIPSPMDNWPCTMLEAMAASRVVVASRAGGMGELIRDGEDGLLFRPGDEADLARVITRAMAMAAPARASMGASARVRVAEVCDPLAIVEQRVRVYRAAMERRKACISGEGRIGLTAESADDVMMIGTDALSASAVCLRRALERDPQADFAHGWTRGRSGRVHVFATPTETTLADSPRYVGPIAVRSSALRRLGIEPGVSGWPLAMRLARSGLRGRVVPQVLADLGSEPEDPSIPAEDAFEEANSEPSRARLLARAIRTALGRGRTGAPTR